jgi:DNA primase
LSLENVDLSDPRNQEAIFREYLTRTGLDSDEVEEQLDYAIKTSKLESFSEKYYAKLLDRTRQEKEALAAQSAQRTKEAQERETVRQQSYVKTLEGAIKQGDINGYPINQNEAAALFDYVTDKTYQLPNGQKISEFEFTLAKMRQEDPQKFLAVARLVQADLDLSPIKKKGVSEETNSIFKELQNKSKKGQKTEPKKETELFSKYFGRR